MSPSQTQEFKPGQDFKDGVHKLGERVGEMKDNLSGFTHDAASTARAGVQEVSRGVRRTVDSGRKTAADVVDGLSEQVSARPLTTIGVAVGVGFLIGFFMRRPRA